MMNWEHIADLLWSDSQLGAFLHKLTANTLEIRAAANGGIPENDRPVKRRVIRRVISSHEFRILSAKILVTGATRQAGVPEATISEAVENLLSDSEGQAGNKDSIIQKFYETLIGNHEFSTLVLEAIEIEKRWSDLLQHDFKSLGERLFSLIEKIFSPDHPVSRALATIILSVFSVGLSYKIAVSIDSRIPKELLIPVRVELRSTDQTFRVALDANSLSQDVPIRFIAPDPVNLDFHVRNPLNVNLIGAIPPLSAHGDNDFPAYDIVTELRRLNSAVGAPESLSKGKSPTTSGTLISAVESVSNNLGQVSVPMQGLVAATKENGTELHALWDEMSKAEVHSRSVQEVFSRIPATSTLDLVDGEGGTVVLQWLNEDLEPTSCAVTVLATAQKGTANKFDVRLSGRNCSPADRQSNVASWDDDITISQNEPFDLGGKHGAPFHGAISGVDRHWWKKTEFIVRFQPDARPWQSGTSRREKQAKTSPEPDRSVLDGAVAQPDRTEPHKR